MIPSHVNKAFVEKRLALFYDGIRASTDGLFRTEVRIRTYHSFSINAFDAVQLGLRQVISGDERK